MSRSLFGYANTTKAIAKSGGWEIFDDKFKESLTDEFGNALLPVQNFDPEKSELEIPSPGFPPKHELIKNAKNLISEYDFFAEKMPFSVWISGTNGKTTTTKMTQHLLESYGSAMGGNVGVGLGDMDQNAKIWILETSSFTMHYTKTAKPGIYALLPITPDHLSWHGSMDAYIKAKLKPLEMMSENAVAIVPKAYANTPTKAKLISYENEADLAENFGINLQMINFKTPFLLDGVFALAIEKILLDKCDYERLNSFVIEANKLEEFHDKLGRLWVNDTKATNIDATIQAIKRYENKSIKIILGGDDKGVDLSVIFEILASKKAKIYAIGSNTQKILNLAKKFDIPAQKCEFLQVAVNAIASELGTDEVALLSPACASLDQFKSYAQRGDKFKQFVSLINN
ncbi:MAG: UDP-N-acetylmuramoyl-L-alanine--D-glutamate ligase [Campylobacter sp.]|nr:UDP-N-acetylmuramoyl-L-alanine--D-glutamate ligase [Campylobacter sp.]